MHINVLYFYDLQDDQWMYWLPFITVVHDDTNTSIYKGVKDSH